MSNDLNRCTFIGRLAADPEVRYAPSGDAICNFRIGCGWKTKENSGTEWINCYAFGKLAEICGEYLAKGSQVYVEGRFKTRKWQDKEGKDRYSTEINLDKMQMLGKPAQQKDANQDVNAGKPKRDFDNFEDDIPF